MNPSGGWSAVKGCVSVCGTIPLKDRMESMEHALEGKGHTKVWGLVHGSVVFGYEAVCSSKYLWPACCMVCCGGGRRLELQIYRYSMCIVCGETDRTIVCVLCGGGGGETDGTTNNIDQYLSCNSCGCKVLPSIVEGVHFLGVGKGEKEVVWVSVNEAPV